MYVNLSTLSDLTPELKCTIFEQTSTAITALLHLTLQTTVHEAIAFIAELSAALT